MEDLVLEFIEKFIGERGYSPTYREIMLGCGVSSTSMVSYYIKRLARRGLITYEFASPRTVRIKENSDEGIL